ncbi:hypothetical protein, partial [Pseudomonas sp. NFACC46-3]|uniref:hypothetical protein n=1 Tax=Pseudomonas sp. NFACC46-3 TaxID=1566200 RepID=UPI00147A2951
LSELERGLLRSPAGASSLATKAQKLKSPKAQKPKSPKAQKLKSSKAQKGLCSSYKKGDTRQGVAFFIAAGWA